jgi:hypothetical protein
MPATTVRIRPGVPNAEGVQLAEPKKAKPKRKVQSESSVDRRAKRARGLKGARKPTLADALIPAKLTDRQERLRQLLFETRGTIEPSEVARIEGVSTVDVWIDKRAISALGPARNLEGWDEDAEIHKAIDYYDSAIGYLIDELRRVAQWEREREAVHDRRQAAKRERLERDLKAYRAQAAAGNKSRKGTDYQVSIDQLEDAIIQTMNPVSAGSGVYMRARIMDLMAQFRRDYSQFLLATGLVREAPSRIEILPGAGLSSASTAAEIEDELKLIQGTIRRIRTERTKATNATTGIAEQ